eukprot:SAG11_NODE_6163_length_1373_cov_2.829670_2_plen_243_part_00
MQGEVARRLAREVHPNAGTDQIEAAAKALYEEKTTHFLVRTIEVAKQLRPYVTLGYWDMSPGRVEMGDSATRAALKPLWAAVDALFPSIYLPAPKQNGNAEFVKQKLGAARALADERQPSPLPIYVYTQPEYLSVWSSGDAPPLNGSDFDAEYVLPGSFGIARLVLYGESVDGATTKRCRTMLGWEERVLLPSLKRSIAERNGCAARRCSGHGRCVDFEPCNLSCACMGGFAGARCERRVHQ